MKLHANAALSLKGRRELCRWVVEGELRLHDRSSAPRSIPHRTSESRTQAIVALRRLRFTGPEIAEVLGMAASTVSGILTRIGMGKLGRVGPEPARRYERARPGRAGPHRHQEAGADRARCRSADRRHRQPRKPSASKGLCRGVPSDRRLGVRAYRDR
jgi:hypothetical protein